MLEPLLHSSMPSPIVESAFYSMLNVRLVVMLITIGATTASDSLSLMTDDEAVKLEVSPLCHLKQVKQGHSDVLQSRMILSLSSA